MREKIEGDLFRESSKSERAYLWLQNKEIFVYSLTGKILLRCSVDRIQISMPLANIKQSITFPGGETLEVDSSEDLSHLLIGRKKKKIHNLFSFIKLIEDRPVLTLIAICFFLLSGFLVYRSGLPLLAKALALRVPHSMRVALSNESLKTFDKTAFKESGLSSKEKQRFINIINSWDFSEELRLKLIFRSSRYDQPNAFALPDGRIILLDELINKIEDINLIKAILLHEAGHVKLNHGTQMLVYQSLFYFTISYLLGNYGELSIPSKLLQKGYSRDFEKEADLFACGQMRQLNIPMDSLKMALDKISPKSQVPSAFEWLSTHPRTESRNCNFEG